MADQAQIRSIEDIGRFRAQLLTFLSAARVAVEEAAMEAARQQAWLELDRRRHWEGEQWRRQRRLDEARQSLFQESIASQRGPASLLQMQVHRAERALEPACIQSPRQVRRPGRMQVSPRQFQRHRAVEVVV